MSSVILLAMVAAFILLRLRSVLGRRTGHESPPQRDITPSRRDLNAIEGKKGAYDEAGDLDAAYTVEDTLKDLKGKSRTAAEQILKIEDFNPREFLGGAEKAYGMILEAFWAGKLDEVKFFLSDTVYDQFNNAIKAREDDGFVVENRLLEITQKNIDQIEIMDRHARVVVQFVSQIVSLTRDKDGQVVEGDLSDSVEVKDVWTFTRELGSRDMNWTLTATRAG